MKQAAEKFDSAFQMRLDRDGPGHARTLKSKTCYARALESLALEQSRKDSPDIEKALDNQRKAVMAYRWVLAALLQRPEGESHTRTQRAHHDLGTALYQAGVYRDQQGSREARSLFRKAGIHLRKAWEGRERSKGKHHNKT